MLTPALIERLVNEARVSEPHELCGLLFPVAGFVRCRNTAARPEHEFRLEPDEYEAACRFFGEQPWALVHSHPGKAARPSLTDYALMDALQLAKQTLAMVIVGLQPVEIRCFTKVGDNYPLQWVWHG